MSPAVAPQHLKSPFLMATVQVKSERGCAHMQDATTLRLCLMMEKATMAINVVNGEGFCKLLNYFTEGYVTLVTLAL